MPTLFGIIRDMAGAAIPGVRLAFRPETSRPAAMGADVSGRGQLDVTCDTAGFFSQPLISGSYYLWVGASRRSSIYVPASPDYILLADLFAGATGAVINGGANWRLQDAERQLLNATTGTWHTPFIDDVGGQKELAWGAAGVSSATPNFRYRSGMLELYCADTNTWHAPYLDGGVLTIAEDGSSPVENDRFIAGTWQLKDVTTGLWRSWYLYGNTGEEMAAFGPEEA